MWKYQGVSSMALNIWLRVSYRSRSLLFPPAGNDMGMKPEGAPQIFHWISGGPWHLKSSKGWSQSPACRGGLLLLRKQAEWKVRVVLKDSRHGTPAVKTWGSQHRWSIASKEVWTLGKLQGRDFGIRLDPASHPASHRLNFWTCQVAWFPFDPVSPLTASAPDPPLSPKISPQDQLFVPGFCWGVCQWCLGFGDNLPRPPNSPIPRTMAQRIVPWRCRTAPCVCPPPVAAKTIWLWSCRNWHGPAPCWNSCWDCETAGLFAGWGISMCHRNHVKTIILWPWRMTREPVTFPASDLRFEQPQLPNLCVAAQAPALCGQTGSVVPVGGWPTER